jgi:hypothetical protein
MIIGCGGFEGSIKMFGPHINPRKLSFTASRIVKSEIKDVTVTSNLIPLTVAPIAIANAIHAIKQTMAMILLVSIGSGKPNELSLST